MDGLRRPRICVLACLAAVLACDATGPAAARVVAVEQMPAEAPVRALRITLDRPAPVEVTYGTSEQGLLRVSSAAAEVHEVILGRLLPERGYSWEIEGLGSGSFTSPGLPTDLAALRFDATGTLSIPLVLLHLFETDGFKGYVVVDGSGRIVWWWRTEDFPFAFVRRAGGTFVYLDRGAGLREITPAGDVLAAVPQDTVQRELHHDVIATPRNTLLIIAHDPRTIDGTKVRGDAIWEWTPETGALAKRWSAWDHLDIDDDRGPRFGTEWMHANALALGPSGEVLLSVHYFNQVLALSPDFANVRWRLGGVNATIAVDAPFSGQHTPGFVEGETILMFDNALERGGPSRALELRIAGDRAEPVWEWTTPAGNFASAVGAARRLPGGNTLVTFGMSEGLNGSTGPTEVWEVTPDGVATWHLRVTGASVMFRAEPLETVAGEH